MTELKFRAWNNETMDYEMEPEFMGQLLCGDNDFDYPIMQFTGLLDKNGKEIYEGDILEFLGPWKALKNGGGQMKIMKLPVSFEFGSFIVKEEPSDHTGWIINFLSCPEIIGNIYENPDIL